MRDVNATILIDLKRTKEEIWGSIDRSRRKNVNKAVRNHCVFLEKYEEEDLKKCYKIYCDVWIEGGTNPKPFEIWKNAGKIFIVKSLEKILGSVIIEIKADRIILWAVSSDVRFKDIRVNDFIYWNCLLYGIEKEYPVLDLGGWQINARGHLGGINNFKEKWGGKITYTYSNYPFFQCLGRKLIRNFGLFWWLNKKLKGRK